MKTTKLAKKALCQSLLACAMTGALLVFSAGVEAEGLASGPKVEFAAQGHIGEVVVNPYKVAPLTAVIRNGGYEIHNAKVRVLPKVGGQEIHYTVADAQLRTHAGIPVFGLYANYVNTVEVTYDRVFKGKTETFTERYRFWTPPVATVSNGTKDQPGNMLEAEVLKMSDKYADRLYFVNNIRGMHALSNRLNWNNPSGGALTWNQIGEVGILDSKGEIRWVLDAPQIYDFENPYMAGVMMGFRQGADGKLNWGCGQRYAKYDITGREIYNRRLPASYNDFSHATDPAQNGHVFLRVASADYRRADDKRVRTVRDVIAEVDQNGDVVDEFKLFDILDPYRSNVIKVLDQGAVCLNIDVNKIGKTLTNDELQHQEEAGEFGDVPGVGAGRNWAHVNAVDYDPTDDSIIVSSRHQSAVIKIGRDKKVKWILGSPEGWRDGWAEKVLTPVDAKGNKIKCEASKCEGDFDWSWTQHTAWRIDSKSDANVVYLTVFDNGDARGMEQPALPSEKYSRAVVYKVDQQKMTVEQVWAWGNNKNEFYSPVTGLCEYQKDKDSVVAYFSTASEGGFAGWATGTLFTKMNPYITEFNWGAKEPDVIIKLKHSMGYQAFPFDVQKAFNPQ